MTTGLALSPALVERLAALRASGYSNPKHKQTDESWAKVREFVRHIPNDYRRLVATREPRVKTVTVTKGKDVVTYEAKIYDWTALVHGHDVSYQVIIPSTPDVKDRALVTAFYEPKGLSVIKDLTALSL